jgi:DNA-binding MarR family transcriptional regulator
MSTDAARPLDPAEEAMWRPFVHILNVMPRVLDTQLRGQTGVTAPEYVALTALADNAPDGLRIGALATRVALSQSRVSRLADSLVVRGDVERHQAPDDGRSQVLAITETGLERLQNAWPHHLRNVRRLILDHIDRHDFDTLTRTFQAIARDIDYPY